VEGTGDDALALEFAHVADVDELHVVAAMQVARLLDAESGDGGGGLGHHRLDGLAHLATPFCGCG
jgi:hypothetical protein